jgi:arylsulfatase A-like enzyme
MNLISRRDFNRLIAAGLGWAALPRLASSAPVQQRKPNIIFILADDLGYGDLGCYGQKRIKTPNLDRMAREGMRFTQHYAGSTVCAPSRCVLMTGLHTGHCYIRGNARMDLRPSDVTVAKLLKKAGYATGLIGKWGLGQEGGTGVPTKQGFDYFYGYLDQGHAHNYYPTFLFRKEERISLSNVVPNEGKAGQGVATKKVQYSHDLFTQEALQFVDSHSEGPFFLYLAYTIPHANNEAGKKGMEVPDYGIYKDKDWPEPQKGHAAMISRMDGDIGRLFERLKKHGLDDNTIIFFSSDNGPHREGGADPDFFDSNGPLRGIKRALYEGGIRVPLLVRWPGKVKPARVSDHLSGFWDFLPTAAELAGVEIPENIDGISFLPSLLGKKQKQHKSLYWEFHEQGGKQALRMGKWKAVRLNVKNNPDNPLELYDLEKDIAEQHNLAEQHPDIVKQMRAMLAKSRTESERFQFPRSGK